MASKYFGNGNNRQMDFYKAGIRTGQRSKYKEMVAKDLPVIYSMICVELAETEKWETEKIAEFIANVQGRWVKWVQEKPGAGMQSCIDYCREVSGIDLQI